ncbi:MAG: hypothetical protein BSOLF_1645 [Candidatus Carbobacillus altaicus]|uniref:Uncharacterized protein n=1 Tax=Candidatus Carbonibacillus altaicus TaxID=2163959 RepID=A0A2R6Y3R3_9BACL|nr:MAG: hypothetical protein BSOLF_1645 [Candidatus Carbobacillus altaicus]
MNENTLFNQDRFSTRCREDITQETMLKSVVIETQTKSGATSRPFRWTTQTLGEQSTVLTVLTVRFRTYIRSVGLRLESLERSDNEPYEVQTVDRHNDFRANPIHSS